MCVRGSYGEVRQGATGQCAPADHRSLEESGRSFGERAVRCCLITLMAIAIASCSADATNMDQAKVYVLPDGRVRTESMVGDINEALKHLGPPSSTQVVFAVCPAADFRAVRKVLVAVEGAGYERAFLPIEKSDSVCAMP